MGTGNSSSLRLGVDLGGTKIEAVVVDLGPDRGPGRAPDREPEAPEPIRVLSRIRRPTERTLGYEHVLTAVAELIKDVTREAGLSSPPPIGVGMPGSITRSRRTVKNSNTTCLNGRAFREDLIARVGCVGQPIEFANDANCFALAEARFGAGRGYSLVFGVILGTGVGGGIVIGDRVWDGLQGIAGEWGHVALDPDSGPPCYCGRAGCIETFLSGPALEAEYVRRAGTALPLPAIAARAATAPGSPAEDDVHARAVIAQACARFGRAIATVINILDPEVIVVGGGVSHLDALYSDGVAAAARWVFNDELVTPIRKHQIGDSAGVIGAALLPRSPA